MRHKGDVGTHDSRTSQGVTGTWVQSKGGKGGGQMDVVNGSRFRHAARVADSSGGGWWVAGVDDVQVDGVFTGRGGG